MELPYSIMLTYQNSEFIEFNLINKYFYYVINYFHI